MTIARQTFYLVALLQLVSAFHLPNRKLSFSVAKKIPVDLEWSIPKSPFRSVSFSPLAPIFDRTSCLTKLMMVKDASEDGTGESTGIAATFDEVAYEKDRLEKDAQAMDNMKEVAEFEFSQLRTPWKWVIRKRIWDLMEERDIARPPRPVHHRIPNFVGADQAAARLATLEEFQEAKCVKVNPDTPQRPVRHLVLEQGKTLLTPQPRLRTGFFSTIQMSTLPSLVKVADCTNSAGVVKYGTSVTLNDKYNVDLVVVGSTAVCPKTGARVGKGEGFAELEWGILSLQGNLDPSTTLVVTTVHEEQLVDDMMEDPLSALTKHDVPVDIIVTPKRIIRVPNRMPKPSGVYWDLLSPQKLASIRVLRQLKQEIEKRDQVTLPSGPDEVLPPVASRKDSKSKKNPKNNKNTRKNTQNNNKNRNRNNSRRKNTNRKSNNNSNNKKPTDKTSE